LVNDDKGLITIIIKPNQWTTGLQRPNFGFLFTFILQFSSIIEMSSGWAFVLWQLLTLRSTSTHIALLYSFLFSTMYELLLSKEVATFWHSSIRSNQFTHLRLHFARHSEQNSPQVQPLLQLGNGLFSIPRWV